MTKLTALVISGTIFSTALVAQAADKAPAAPAPAAAAASAAAKPVAAKTGAPEPAKAASPPTVAEKAATPPAGAAPAGPPTPSPEIETLYKAFEGSWKCDTTFAANAMGPGSPETKAKSEVKIKKQPGGFWYVGEYKIKKSKTMPGFEGTFVLGYDAGLKQAVSINYDGMGGYAVESGAGSTPGKLVFAGESHMMGMKAKMSETMTKTDKGVEHTFAMDMGKGPMPMGTDVCTK
ncbi:MAG TPA: DUF1579 family protein [Polyangia bacterium]|nr:DUF1579 family protein [Polyangia bacterium]